MKEKETQYRREVLLKDPRFARYQPDFLAAVLNKPYYTATAALLRSVNLCIGVRRPK